LGDVYDDVGEINMNQGVIISPRRRKVSTRDVSAALKKRRPAVAERDMACPPTATSVQ
jgi:hypothetical protein